MYGLDPEHMYEIELWAAQGLTAPYIADEMDLPLYIVEAYLGYLDDLYGEEPR